MKSARWEIGRSHKALRITLALAGLAACHAGLAQTSGQQAAQAGLAADTAQLEIASASVPRVDRVEGFQPSQRVDLTLMPPKDSSVGLALGMNGYSQPASTIGAGLAPSATPSVDVGLHWRSSATGNYRIGVTAWRRVPQASAETVALGLDRDVSYGARVEVDLNRGKKEAAWADKGLVGVQLDNGGRVSLRRKHGGPMIYYRNSF